MAQKHEETGWVDMDRLSRIFTWLVAVIVTFMLGMAFDQVIFADATAMATFSQTGVPYTVTYPAGWSAGFDRKNDLVAKTTSAVAADSDSMLVLDDSPITQIASVSESYLVTVGKIRADSVGNYDRIIGTPGDTTKTSLTIPGVISAIKTSDVKANGDTMDRVVMTVGADIYVMDLVTKRGAVDYSTDADAVLASLKFGK